MVNLKVNARVQFNSLGSLGAAAQRWAEGLTSEAAGEIQHEARQRVHVVTGRLYESIQIREEGGGYVVEATAPYAGYEEFGTRYRPPHPYFYPAVETVRPKFNAQARSTLEGALGGRVTRGIGSRRSAGIEQVRRRLAGR